MNKKISFLIGGHSGISLVIKNALEARGDKVYTASRRFCSLSTHYQINLPDISKLPKDLKINYLIFAHRYRGDSWDDNFSITVKSVDSIINHFKDNFMSESSIVILGSNSAQLVSPEQDAAYHATRAALEGLTKYYAYRLGSINIRCNCILPNSIIKPENSSHYSLSNPIRNMITRITPIGRMGDSADVANLVDFLCSEKSSFINGQSLFVDGGISIISPEYIGRLVSGLE